MATAAGRRSRSSSINAKTTGTGGRAHQRRPSEAVRLASLGDPPSVSTTSVTSLTSATSIGDVRASLAALHAREQALTTVLDGLTSAAAQAELGRDLLRLDGLRATLGTQVIATRGIAGTMLAGAAETAGRLSSTVRSLDLEKTRVEATLRVVEQVAELKACVAGVAGSMGAPQDWEAAAAYLARASRVPDAIVQSGFARAVVPTVEVPDAPATTLDAARESLCTLFLREFERAADARDEVRVTRFFKLFPLIGRSEAGLDVYGRYVCQGVAQSARSVWAQDKDKAKDKDKDARFYVHALSKLFAQIAQIVEGHSAIVERHYGAGQMGRVIERLQKEADVQGGAVLDAFADDRALDRRLTEVKSYPFNFLVQSFLNLQRGDDARSTPSADTDDEGGVSMPEVNALLGEMASLLALWAYYTKLLATRWAETKTETKTKSDTEPKLLVYPSVLAESNLHKKVATRLATPFHLLCVFLYRRAVERAFQLEEPPSTTLSLRLRRPLDANPPYIFSSVDVVMYMTDQVATTLLKAHAREAVQAVLPPMGRVLASDFVGMVQRRMRDEAYPRAQQPPPPATDGLGPLVGTNGSFPSEDRVVQFVLLVNTLDMAVQYLAKVVSAHMGVPVDDDPAADADATATAPARIPAATAPAVLAHLRDAFPFEHDAELVAGALAQFYSTFAANAGDLAAEGVALLFHQVVKPRLRPLLAAAFRDTDYALTELDVEQQRDEYAEYGDLVDDADAVGRRFEAQWSDGLLAPLRRLMTPRTFAQLADTAARHLAKMLEKRVWSQQGRLSAYGAVRLERDLNAVVGAVARSSGRYGVRALFAKTTQILVVANMEEDEWDEVQASVDGADGDGGDDDDDDYNGMVWLLTEDERRRARSMVKR